jgi:rhamnosyltransferase
MKVSKISGIIVIYRPPLNAIENIKKILSILESVIVVINEATSEFIELLKETNAAIINNDSNVGLSSALNIGIKYAFLTNKSENVILFDQDSCPDDDMINKLMRSKEILETKNMKLCIVGPEIVDIKRTSLQERKESRGFGYDKKVVSLITSGVVLSAEVVIIVGLMNEEYFIDCIDHDYSFRALSKGILIYKISDAKLIHNLGDFNFNFIKISKPMHTNTLRHYYIIRNSILLVKKPYSPLKWKIVETFKIFRRVIAYPILSKNKMESATYVLQGLIDGIRGVTGVKKFKTGIK